MLVNLVSSWLYVLAVTTRVISSGDLYCCLLPQCEALCTCRSGFPIATLLQCACIGHFHSLTLTLDLSDLWKHSFRFTHATLHTISKCAAYRYQRSLPRCISSGVTDGGRGANCSHGKINAKTGPPRSILLAFSRLLFLCIFWSVFWRSRIDMHTDHIDGHAHRFGFTIISQVFNGMLGWEKRLVTPLWVKGFTLSEASSYAIVHSLTKCLHSKVTRGKRVLL